MGRGRKVCTGHTHHHRLEGTVKEKHLRKCQFVTIVGGATNVFFCGTKILFGASGGSVALVADGFHALFDLLADLVSYVTLTLSARRLPRCRFPFGIGRIETAGAVVVAVSLLLGGVALLFQSLGECRRQFSFRGGDDCPVGAPDPHDALHRHHHGHSHFQMTHVDDAGRVTVLWAMALVSAASIVGKELLFRWTRRVGELAGSRVVVANAYHHRADAWSGAVALVGVAGHCVGLPAIDGLAGLCVSGGICRVGYSLLRGSVLEFFDFQNAKEVADVKRELQQHPEYRPINVFLIRHGQSYALHVTLLVEAHTPAPIVVAATKELTVLARHSVPVTDTYTALCVCDRQQETSLRHALKMVEEFHGLAPILCDWEKKQIAVEQTLHNECMEDIRSVALLFGLEIVVAGQ